MVSGGTRFGGAWVLSAVVHALVIAWLLRLSAPRSRTPPIEALPVSIAIEITEAPREATERAPAPRPPVASSPSPERRPSRRSPPPKSPPRASTPLEPPEVARSPASTASPPRAIAPPRDLSFRALPPDVQLRFAGTPPDAAIVSRPARPGRRSVDQLRADVERAEIAAANVSAGRADPLLYDYLRGASARFQADAQRLADDLEVGLGSAASGWGRGYLARVGDANRGALGARADATRAGGGDAPNEPSPHADALGAYNEANRQAEGGAEERRAEVCLNVAPGQEPAASLRRSSGNTALDRLALDSFTRAAAARPVPPDTPRGLACYELRITAYRVPPLPMFSCAFDLTGATCIWPFKKIASVKSRLLSVEYPPGAGAPEPSSLLRRPR
jgi:hypothetical protein